MRSYLTPKPELIRSRIARDWTPHRAIAEFVDNSLAPNKGAARDVYVELVPGYIEITDHGAGCDDINRLFCLGDSSSYGDRNDIGLYGVGATDACIWLGTIQLVETVRDGRLRRMEHNWDPNNPKWPRPYRGKGEVVRDDHPLATGGTRIRISRLRKGRVFHAEKLKVELGRLFAPGLLQDMRIFVRRGSSSEWETVLPFEGPAIDRERSIRWSGDIDGKAFFAEVGWMAPPRPEFNCLHLAFQHRLIERTTDFFIDKRSGLITGWLYLSGDWKFDLEDHKGCLVPGPDRDALMRNVYEKILPLIEAAEHQERKVALDQLAARLNERLHQVDLTRGSNDGAIDESARQNKHEKGQQVDRTGQSPRSARGSGDRGVTSKPMTGVSIGWFQDPERRLLVQTREEAGHLRVLFNTDHPEIAKATAEPANHFGLVSTAMRCVAHLITDWSEDRRQKTVPAFESMAATTRVETADALYAFLMRDISFGRRGQLVQDG